MLLIVSGEFKERIIKEEEKVSKRKKNKNDSAHGNWAYFTQFVVDEVQILSK